MLAHLCLEQSNIVSVVLQQNLASIGFCAADGCKFAATGLYAINGIARSPSTPNDTFYVAHSLLGGVSLFTKQSDNRLLLDEHIKTGRYAGRTFLSWVSNPSARFHREWPRQPYG